MVNTTETFWSVDGVSLQTYAFNITTLGGDRMSPPPLRGADLVIPYQAGQTWVPKVVDSKTITLGMWVIGADEAGNIPQDEDSRRTFERNWRKLRKLLWTPRRQVTLTKRFWVPVEDLTDAGLNLADYTVEGGWALMEASGKAQFSGGLEPSMGGPSRAAFTVDLRMADPFFYGTPVDVEFTTQTASPNIGPTRNIEVLGDERTTRMEIWFEGPLTSPRLTVANYSPAPWVQFTTTIADGDEAVLDTATYSATFTESSVPHPAAGSVTHYGDASWLYLDPGAATISLTAASGTGRSRLSYIPTWL